jgi:hypothetical protein
LAFASFPIGGRGNKNKIGAENMKSSEIIEAIAVGDGNRWGSWPRAISIRLIHREMEKSSRHPAKML